MLSHHTSADAKAACSAKKVSRCCLHRYVDQVMWCVLPCIISTGISTNTSGRRPHHSLTQRRRAHAVPASFRNNHHFQTACEHRVNTAKVGGKPGPVFIFFQGWSRRGSETIDVLVQSASARDSADEMLQLPKHPIDCPPYI